jgi:hypothetical protein
MIFLFIIEHICTCTILIHIEQVSFLSFLHKNQIYILFEDLGSTVCYVYEIKDTAVDLVTSFAWTVPAIRQRQKLNIQNFLTNCYQP